MWSTACQVSGDWRTDGTGRTRSTWSAATWRPTVTNQRGTWTGRVVTGAIGRRYQATGTRAIAAAASAPAVAGQRRPERDPAPGTGPGRAPPGDRAARRAPREAWARSR